MSRLNILFLIAFVGVLVWLTLSPGAVSTIQRGALVVFRPFMKASTTVEGAVEGLGSESLSPAQMRTRIAELEKERDRLRLEVIQQDEILTENNQLRKALQYVERSPYSLVAARIINRKPSTWYNTIVIDKGSHEGIGIDSPVIVPVGKDAGLVGKVSEVIGEHSAVVLLLTDEMCQVSAKLENSQEQGILSGERGALRTLPNLTLRYLSKEAGAVPGQRIFSSGTGELFPANLLLGEVIDFEVGVIDSTAKVKPLVSFESLLDVFVVLPREAQAEPVEETPEEETPEPVNQTSTSQ